MDTPKFLNKPTQPTWPTSPRPSVEQILRSVHITSHTRELDLSYARGLTPGSLKALLMCLPNLRKLTIRHTDIGRLPDAFGYVPELRELDVSDNGLMQLPPSLGKMAKLQHLTATGNRIEMLPASLGRLHNLRFLNVSSNRLVALGPECRFLKSLRVLRLASNRLTQLHAGIGELQNLQLLQLSFNRLRELPPELGHATQLRVLNVAFNALDAFPQSLSALTGLAHLDITGNDMHALPACFAALDTLRVRGLEQSRLRGQVQETQVTAQARPARPANPNQAAGPGNLPWSDEGAGRTLEFDFTRTRAAASHMIGGLKRALSEVVGVAAPKALPHEKTVLHGHFVGQVVPDVHTKLHHTASADATHLESKTAGNPSPASRAHKPR